MNELLLAKIYAELERVKEEMAFCGFKFTYKIKKIETAEEIIDAVKKEEWDFLPFF